MFGAELRRRSGKLAAIVPLAVFGLATCWAGEPTASSWLGWGGPTHDFQAPAGKLAASWPDDGPQELWRRPLGEGYSAILVEDGRLYTMYRDDDQEAVVCLDAATGKTLWERRYKQSSTGEAIKSFGVGPRSTPLIVGKLLFTVGVSGTMHALDKQDGRVVWRHDLWDETFDGRVLGHGYSSSPVAYQDKVIVPVGGTDSGLVAFHQKSGTIAWRSLSLDNSYSSPQIVEILGETQLLVFMADELIGVDPDTGALRWSYEHTNQWRHNITLPTVVDGDTIFLSSAQTGARSLKLERVEGKIAVDEVWSTRRVQFYHATSVRIGDWVYGSTGVMSPAFMTGINLRTGEIAWRERGFAKANCVAADGKLVILDENGVLYLAEATPEKLTVRAQAQLLDRVAWTVPTLVGQTLYARDNEQIVAIDLR